MTDPSCFSVGLGTSKVPSLRCVAVIGLGILISLEMVVCQRVDPCKKDEHFDSATGECRSCKSLCRSPLQKRIKICLYEHKCKPFWPLVSTPSPVHEIPQKFTTLSTNLPDTSPSAQDGMSPLFVVFLVLLILAVMCLLVLVVLYILKKGWLVKLHKSWFQRRNEIQEEGPEVAQPLHAAARPDEFLSLADAKHPTQVEAVHPGASTGTVLVTNRTAAMAPAVDHMEDTRAKVV